MIAAIVLLLIEVTFFNGGIVFSMFLFGTCVYFGRKKMTRTLWKILFWFGCVGLFFTVVTMMTFKFMLLAIILYFIVQYVQSKQHPLKVLPIIEETSLVQGTVINKHPLFKQVLFGRQQTPDHVYEWNDVNIQTGVGDTTIDLSNTVLPKGESVISIRNFVGNLKILVPYEMELSVRHAVLYGSSTILEHQEVKTLNQILYYQTLEYGGAEQKVKIITSMLVGDLEVVRV